jgi:hypothetical protein
VPVALGQQDRGHRAPQLKLLLETVCPNPACITSRTLDLLATNPGGPALYAGIDDWPAIQRNLGRFLSSTSRHATFMPTGTTRSAAA